MKEVTKKALSCLKITTFGDIVNHLFSDFKSTRRIEIEKNSGYHRVSVMEFDKITVFYWDPAKKTIEKQPKVWQEDILKALRV